MLRPCRRQKSANYAVGDRGEEEEQEFSGPPTGLGPIGNLLYSLRRSFAAPSSPSPPCGLGPAGDDQGQARWTADDTAAAIPEAAARSSRTATPASARACPSPSTPPLRLPASHPAARGDAPYGRSSRKPALSGLRLSTAARRNLPFFSLPRAVPRLLLGACDGGSEGDGQARAGHRFHRPMVKPVLVGPARYLLAALPRGCLMLQPTKEDRNFVKKTMS